MNQKWLRARRKELGLTQDDVAARLQLAGLDISRAMVSHWENERNIIPIQNQNFLSTLANVLQTTELSILIDAGYITKVSFSGEAMKAAELVDRMPAEKRDTAIAILEQLAK